MYRHGGWHSVILCIVMCVADWAGAEDRWTNYGETIINDIALYGQEIWCATTTGVICWDRTDNTSVTYTMADGLVYNYIDSNRQ